MPDELTTTGAGAQTDVAIRQESGTSVAAPGMAGVGQMLDAMMALARDPTVDAAKFETIARVANEQQDRALKTEYYQAKARAIRAMPTIRKDGRIVIAGKNGEADRVQGHFEKWPDVQRAITPHLDANYLTLTHDVDVDDGRVVVVPILQHDNGYIERGGRMVLPLDTSGGKNNVQGSGSSQSYGLRYTTRAMLGLKFEPGHDDGNLIALPDEPLNDQQQRRVQEAEMLWAADPEQFEVWWAKLQPQDKAWMVQTGRYEMITGKTGGLLTHRDAPRPDAGAPKKGPIKTASGRDVSTPEGWTAQYEDDCRAASSLDALAEVQRKGAGAMGKLQANGLTDLHSRAITAGSDAYARLSAVEGND